MLVPCQEEEARANATPERAMTLRVPAKVAFRDEFMGFISDSNSTAGPCLSVVVAPRRGAQEP
jgi:hypothetical protein